MCLGSTLAETDPPLPAASLQGQGSRCHGQARGAGPALPAHPKQNPCVPSHRPGGPRGNFLLLWKGASLKVIRKANDSHVDSALPPRG